jgi:hypothetical protein
LLDAVERGRVNPEDLGPERVKSLRGHADEEIRRRAERLLPP